MAGLLCRTACAHPRAQEQPSCHKSVNIGQGKQSVMQVYDCNDSKIKAFITCLLQVRHQLIAAHHLLQWAKKQFRGLPMGAYEVQARSLHDMTAASAQAQQMRPRACVVTEAWLKVTAQKSDTPTPAGNRQPAHLEHIDWKGTEEPPPSLVAQHVVQPPHLRWPRTE